ncbi:nitrogen regulation protein NIFR3 [Staphylococcus aureus]|nr:nitrogen regulation protein NIFR3 [Staphylococcus aureus]
MSGVINYQFRLNGVLIFKIELLIYYYVWYTNQCFMLYKVILAVVDCSPQHRGFGMSASISCKLVELQHSGIGFPISTDIANWGNGPQTQKLVESQLKITCKLAGPQNSEIGFLISTDIAN